MGGGGALVGGKEKEKEKKERTINPFNRQPNPLHPLPLLIAISPKHMFLIFVADDVVDPEGLEIVDAVEGVEGGRGPGGGEAAVDAGAGGGGEVGGKGGGVGVGVEGGEGEGGGL